MSNTLVSSLLKVALTVIVVVIAARYVQPGKIFSTLFSVQPAYLIAAGALLIPNLFLQHLRWLMLMRRLDARASSTAAWYSLLAGFPLGLATPGRWGELGRAIFLPEYARSSIAALTVVDKIFSFAAVTLLGAAGMLALVQAGRAPKIPAIQELSFAILLAFVIGIFVLPGVLRRRRSRRAQDKEKSWIDVLVEFDARFMLTLLVLSLAFVTTFCAQLLLLVKGLQPVSAPFGFAAAAATFLTQSLVPLSIGGLGVRESAAAFFFEAIGAAPHAAFSAALLVFIINMLLPSVFGLALLWKNPTKPR